jgi:MoaA/NifB/PqqE/SkfB family radical SAM enzyme
MVTTVTTNGTVLTEKRLGELRQAISLLAISLDGVPASHDRIRRSSRAFASMASRLPIVRDSGIPFGFIFTLTQHNVHELDWVADFAIEQGASQLQIHPLEEVGRAALELQGSEPDTIELAWAFAEVARISKTAGNLRLQLDVATKRSLEANPGLGFASPIAKDRGQRRLADFLAPLIVEADGTVTPLQHGLSRAHSLGNLHEASLDSLAARWLDEAFDGFLEVCQRTFVELTKHDRPPVLNWYREVYLRA